MRTTQMQQEDLESFRCPLCGKPLASDEYHAAIQQLTKRVEETYKDELRKGKEMAEKLKQQMKEDYEKQLNLLKNSYEQQQEQMRTQIEQIYRKQVNQIKTTYDQMVKRTEKESVALRKKLVEQHRKELREKERQLVQLRREQEKLKKLAFEDAKKQSESEIALLKTQLQEKGILLERFKREVEELKKQLQQSQSETKGEAGEVDLFVLLTQAFPEDMITRQHRGTESGDIIQKIRAGGGIVIDQPIVYDNKQAESVSKRDIEKAQKYKAIHNTNYVFIVSRNLPKRDVPNGLFGEREGVFLIHPSVLVEVAKTVRRGILEVNMQNQSVKNREAKEVKLYNYIRGQEFRNNIETLNLIYQSMSKLQDAEERAHQRLWKERKALQTKIGQAFRDITAGLDSIIQENEPMQELLQNTN